MAGPDPGLLDAVADAVAARFSGRLLVAGICGAQGSGKSTLATALVRRLAGDGLRAAALSLDDLYLGRAARAARAARTHPLFITRGVPGTHDIALGLATLAALERGEPAALPRFDKGADEPLPQGRWPRAPAATQVLVLEGWCLGAAAQPPADLAVPVNALEAAEDPDGTWRRHANDQLGGPYRALFDRPDLLVLLAAPAFEVVARWRDEAEEALRRSGAPAAMDPAAMARFVQHYERLTRHVLAEMPARADIVARLALDRSLAGLVRRDDMKRTG